MSSYASHDIKALPEMVSRRENIKESEVYITSTLICPTRGETFLNILAGI